MAAEAYTDIGRIYFTKRKIGTKREIVDALDHHIRSLRKEVENIHRKDDKLDLDGVSHPQAMPYIEGDVAYISGTHPNVDSACYVLCLDDIRKPRPKPCLEYPAGEARDSGLHTHEGGRHLLAYVGSNSMIHVPCLFKPEFHGFEENKDYKIFEKEFSINGKMQSGYYVLFAPNQLIEGQFGKHTAHSFDGIGPNTVITSIHTNDREEAEALKHYDLLQDGTEFLAKPEAVTPERTEHFNKELALFNAKNIELAVPKRKKIIIPGQPTEADGVMLIDEALGTQDVGRLAKTIENLRKPSPPRSI